MNKMTFNSLFVFEYQNKLGKRIDFNKGINIVTSDQKTGNDKGKSILMKSLYHTIGANNYFDGMWRGQDKVYIVDISVNDETYFIYRNKKLFKIYDSNFTKLFSSINRAELAEYMSGIFNFEVQLPNRTDDELELAPPVYSYLLNYIDQDHMSGSKFTSFEGLGQYPDFKENLIYNHFGIFTEKYFRILKEIEKLKQKNNGLEDDKSIIESMLNRVQNYLEGMDAPIDLETLEIELNRKKEEYQSIVSNLKKVKTNLISIRNEKVDLEQNIKELNVGKSKEEKTLKCINHNICPICSHEIKDLDLKIRKNSEIEDFYVMKDQLEKLLLEVERKLTIEEEKYKSFLDKFKLFEDQMKLKDNKISSVIKHKGYLETQANFIVELGTVSNSISTNNTEIDGYKKNIKEYNQLKKKANRRYEECMLDCKSKFNLKEISDSKLKNIRFNIDSRGSNIPIATIIWFFNLLKIKYEFNSNAIRFPIVLDSPNNVELDDDKREALFSYIFTDKDEDTQLIVSTLGFDKNDYPDIEIDKVIELKNDDYCLLNRKDYEKNKFILERFFSNE
jgi:hypothetical protein